MAKDVIMPVLGMAQDSGVVVSWLKQSGQFVAEGEPLLEVETDKAVVEVPAMASGVLADVTAAAGAEVPTGTVIARLLDEDDVAESVPQPGPAPVEPTTASPPPVSPSAEAPRVATTASTVDTHASTAPAPADPSPSSDPVNGRAFPSSSVRRLPSERDGQPKLLASPKAKRLARELGLDIGALRGTGPEGAVRTKDLAASLSSGVTNGTAAATVWLRRAVDLTPLHVLLIGANDHLRRSRRGVTVSSADLLARLTVAAFAASGNRVPPVISITRQDADGRQETCRLTDPLRCTIVGAASTWNGQPETEDPVVQILDLSASPFESSLPPMPNSCSVRLTLASTTGSEGGAGTLTLEHDADPGLEPAALMKRLIELLEDPVAALLYV